MQNNSIDKRLTAEWLIEFILPFANAKGEDEIIERFSACFMAIKGGYCLSNKSQGAANFIKTAAALMRQKRLCELILDSQQFLIDMLTVTLSNCREAALPVALQERIPAIEERVKKNLPALAPSVEWKGQGECSVFEDHYRPENEVSYVERLAVKNITSCLYSVRIEDNFYIGSGFEKVGMCPVCGKFFEKIRKNKEYCSENCAETARMRRVRSIKK